MNKKNVGLLLTFCLLKCFASTVSANESISPFLVYFGSAPKPSIESTSILSAYDLLVIDRFRYRQVNGNTWSAIKAHSSSTKIILYQLGPEIANYSDSVDISALNNLGRYNASRGSSDGSLNKTHPDWFLKNSAGQRVTSIRNPRLFALDYGNKAFVNYWAKHTLQDIVQQEWSADGVYIDDAALCSVSFLKKNPRYVPAKYSDCESWNKNMSNFLTGVSGALQRNGQLSMVNIGNSINEVTAAAWQTLSERSSAPNIMVEEGAFAVSWGDGNDVRFWPVANWQLQIDLPSRVSQQVALISHTDLGPGQTGRSHSGESVSHSQIMRFATGSYMLARNASGPKTYFTFDDDRKGKGLGYRTLTPPSIYEKFDIGTPIGKYKKGLSDQNLYFRKFSKGYVYVNPSKSKIVAIKAESDAVFSSEYENARKSGENWYFDLKPHDAAIVKLNGNGNGTNATPPNPPVLSTK